jgi:hypothetical protein
LSSVKSVVRGDPLTGRYRSGKLLDPTPARVLPGVIRHFEDIDPTCQRFDL